MNKQLSKTSPPAATTDLVRELLKPETFSEFFSGQAWWTKLSKREQTEVTQETFELGSTFMTWGEVKHKVGQHLATVQEILTPHNCFDQYLRGWQKLLNRSRRSLYRDIENYEKAQVFPDVVAKAAAIKNFPIEKLKTVRKMLPVPRLLKTEADALDYIDKAREYGKENPQIFEMDAANVEVKVDEAELMKEALVAFKNCMAKMPSRKKAAWANRVIGMQMTLMGLSSPKQFEPEAVPPEFVRGRGRPSSKTIEGEVASA